MNKRKTVIGALAMILVVAAIMLGARSVPKLVGPKDTGIITNSSKQPDESKKNAQNYQWRGGPGEPKRIIIPKIDVNSYVQKVGVDQSKQIGVPTNIFLVGWFGESQAPGQLGLSVIDGHVTGRINNGVFKHLEKLKAGDEFRVELGNGDTKHFRVTGMSSVPTAQAVSVLFSQDPGVKSQLNLITCSGEYNPQTREYPNRLIVQSELY